ncbi:hypothetical protein KJ765_04965 [Candidatus Micrarchaeota archaeon]|nr:hypothetical protein [Candidatus Micrarchaeota archaeon]
MHVLGEGRMTEKEVGKVLHVFGKLGVAIIELSGTLRIGDSIVIRGPHTDMQQTVESMQIEHKVVTEAKAGESIGLKVNEPVHDHNIVYKLED